MGASTHITVALAITTACAPSLEAAVQEFPKGGWADVSVVPGGGYTWIRSPEGRDVIFFCAVPGSDKLTPLVSVTNTADALHIDARAAFKAGAIGVTMYTAELDLAEISGNDSVTTIIDWSGANGAWIKDYLMGETPDGKGWYSCGEFVSGFERRRQSEKTHTVPPVRKIFHCIDLCDPADGMFRLHRIRTGSYAALGTRKPKRVVPEPLFHASFDNGTEAEFAKGNPKAARAEHLDFVPGVHGQAVKFDSAARPALAWETTGNFDPRRGTAAFWFKKEWKDDSAWRGMLYCPGADRRGGGTLDFWWLGDTMRLDRHDLDNWHQYLGPAWFPTERSPWRYYVFTWDDEATRLYVDGTCVPVWADDALADSHSPMIAALKDVVVHEFDRAPEAFTLFHLGGKGDQWINDGCFDDLKIWSAAMSPDEARALAEAEGAVPKVEPFKVSLGENAYAAPPAKVPGVPGTLKLLRRVRPADEVFAADGFAKVGEIRKGSLDGVAYLEAGRRENDRFAIRFNLDPKTPLHCFEVDYPDDGKRTAEFLVQRSRTPHNDYTLQSGVMCGGEYSTSGKIRTERYVYWTSDADVAFIATTLRAGEPAAVAEIRLYAIEEGRLPAAVAADAAEEPTYPRRHFANYWEDPAFIHDFAANGSTPESLSILIDRFAAYMKFCGQDVLAFPACFYGGRIGEGRYNPRDLPPGCLDAFYAKFDREGLFLVPTINQQRVPVAEGLVTRASMLDGSLHPSAIAIHSTGKPNWGGWHGTPPNFNIAHPDVQREFLRIVRDLAEEGKSHPSFKGVALHLAEVNPLWWGSIESGYNDYCIAAFEKASGIVVPVDRQDPLRGKAYAEWLKANAGDAWVAWRCRVLTDFYARLAKTLSDARSDLKLWVNAMPEWQPETVGFMEPGFREKRLREAGIDAAEIAKRIPNVVLGVTGYPAAWRRWMAWRCEEHRLSASVKDAAREWSVSPAHFAPVASAAAPWGHFHDVYWENPVGANRLGKDVLSNDWLEETRWRVSALHPSGHHALKGFAAALAGSDAQVLSCGGFLVGTLGMEPELAEFMRTFRSLPAVKFTDLPAPPGVVIRTAKCAGRIWRYELQTEHPYGLKVTSEKE